MKLAFTTLGCPKWDMATIIAKAVEYGFQGIEFRGYLGEIKIYQLSEFTKKLGETARKLAGAGLDVPCIDSSAHCFVHKPEDAEAGLKEVKAYATICERLRTPYIRVFGGGLKDIPREKAIESAAAALKRYGRIAADHGVQIVVETHDDWMNSAHLKELVLRADSPAVAVLWDVHHPYRMVGEQPASTWERLGKWIRHTHWKDSMPKAGEGKGAHQLCLTGEGDIPLKKIYDCLKQGGYDGYLSLEWEKMWHPEIEEPEVAFPGFVKVMRGLDS